MQLGEVSTTVFVSSSPQTSSQNHGDGAPLERDSFTSALPFFDLSSDPLDSDSSESSLGGEGDRPPPWPPPGTLRSEGLPLSPVSSPFDALGRNAIKTGSLVCTVKPAANNACF